jgi:hypothetical protein
MKNVPDVKQALADMARLEQERYPDIMLVMRLRTAWYLFGLLQLALRHPKINEDIRRAAMGVMKHLEEYVAATPALTVLAAAGWDADFDDKTGNRPVTAAAQEEPILRDIGADLARALADNVAERRVLCSPLEAGGQVHRVSLLLHPPCTAGPVVFQGDKKTAECTAAVLRVIFTDTALELLQRLRGG